MSVLLQSFLEKLKSGEMLSPFVILYGPGVDDHRSDIRKASGEATGLFAGQDILEIKDYSSELGKQHSIKVEKTKNTEDKNLASEYQYDNLGSREINHRLSLAPSGDLKILLLEHLGRSTREAANALLKNLEEPLPGRMIVASLRNKDMVLETILSRALLIYCDAEYSAPQLNNKRQGEFDACVEALTTNDIGILTQSATNIKKAGRERDFLYNLIQTMDKDGNYYGLMQTIEAYRKLSSNVLSEHVLFQLFIKILENNAD